jgi:hypothetical protein
MTINGTVIGGSGKDGNVASRVGGGIYDSSTGTHTTIISAYIVGNHANGNGANDGGGGIYHFGPALTIDSSTISANAAVANGGGIATESGANPSTVSITNATLSSNAAHLGGAIYSAASIPLTLINGTVANNVSGIVGDRLSSTTVRNTLLANSGTNCAGTITSSDYNLSSDATCALFTQPHDLNGIDPRIGPLSYNGGPTPTHALLNGSPAIDAGGTSANGCPATDQRGVARPQGAACDIGAYELLLSPPPRASGGQPPPVPPNLAPQPRNGISGGGAGGPVPSPLPPSR